MYPMSHQIGTMKRRNLGVKPSGLLPLTGHVGNLRQSDSASVVRCLQPPFETVSSRHPDAAKGRNYLASHVGSLSPARVEDAHSQTADLNSHTNTYVSSTLSTLENTLNTYKQTSIKQATAAHHEKILGSHLERNDPPKGIHKPLLNSIYKSMSVPFKYAPDFQTKINEIAKKCSLEITDCVKQFWEQRKMQLRQNVRSIKDDLYSKRNSLTTEEQNIFTKTMTKTETTICHEKRKMAQSRDWKINEFGKRNTSFEYEPPHKRINKSNGSNRTRDQTRELTKNDFCSATELLMRSGSTATKPPSQPTKKLENTNTGSMTWGETRRGLSCAIPEQTYSVEKDSKDLFTPFSQHQHHETAANIESGTNGTSYSDQPCDTGTPRTSWVSPVNPTNSMLAPLVPDNSKSKCYYMVDLNYQEQTKKIEKTSNSAFQSSSTEVMTSTPNPVIDPHDNDSENRVSLSNQNTLNNTTDTSRGDNSYD